MKKVSFSACVLVAILLLASPAPVSAQAGTMRVAGDLQAWADANRNGTLEPGEMDALGAAVVTLLSGPHPGSTPLDGMFDANRDGRLSPEEVQGARIGFFKAQLLQLVPGNPEIARRVDLNGDGRIDEREAQQVMEFLFVDEKAREPHRADSPNDKKADLNGDGRTGGDEFITYRAQVVRAVAVLPWAPTGAVPGAAPGSVPGAEPGMARVAGDLQRWADVNSDGALDARELDTLTGAATLLLSGPHNVGTPLDGFFDVNRDDRIGPEELERARMEYFKPQIFALAPGIPEAVRLVDLNGNGRIEDPEAQQVLEYLWVDPKASVAHRADSPLDKRADLNNDGRVNGDEFLSYRIQILRFVVQLPWGPSGTEQKVLIASETPAAAPAAAGEARATTPSADTTASTTASTAATTNAATVKLGFNASLDQIYPIFLKYYDTEPIGKATITNAGTAKLENVKVQLVVKEYMTDKKLCATIESLAAGEKKDVSLYALFTRSVLEISEATKAQVNISVEYTAAGQSKTEEFVQTLSFLNRNNMTWDDEKRVAAFVTKNDPAVMLFRAAAVSTVDQGVTAVDANLRAAIAVHEALSLYGIKYWADPKGSYESISKSKTDVDYLQFPAQTLQLKTGDCDDLSILWSALLEASSIDTAFITVPGHIFIAFELGMAPADAKKSALAQEDLIYAKEKAWIPVEVTSIKDGFLKAWQAGAKEWRDASARAAPGFTTFEDASAKFAPVGFSSSTASLSLPADATLAAAYKAELKKLVDREIASQLAAIQAEISKNKDKPEPLNKLGVLYARYGLTDQAAVQFAAALKLSATYVPALVNLGNLSFLKGDAKAALQYFEKAQAREPDKTTVLLGIARANHELENYGKVKEAYEKLKTLNASLAAQFAYLDLQGSDATKAADVAGVSQTVVWDEK